MRFVGLRGASADSWRFGAIFAVPHFVFVVGLMTFAAMGSREAQWQLIFAPLLLLDLPVALLAYPLGIAAAYAAEAAGLPVDGDLVLVFVANGLVGSAFYLIVPPAISAHLRARRERRQTRAGAVLTCPPDWCHSGCELPG